MSIGIDIEDIERFENKSQRFLDKIFTKDEQKYCFLKQNPARHFAVRFCAKEAVIKALTSLNIKHPWFNKIEIYHDNKYPKVRLPNTSEYADLKVEVSLSHDKTKAIAFVIIDAKTPGCKEAK